ncbi:MAG: cytochrome c biogenesis protein CcsA [Deltaproteobacteria bacterium]|nr:cytochrome c biogenesis protein CcsA [Deltaproteobacteria bacterium]
MMPSAPVALFDPLYVGAAVLYLLAALADFAWPRSRPLLLATGVLLHLLGLIARANAISYFPLTNKFESFYAFSFAVFAVALLVSNSPSRVHRMVLWCVGAAFYLWTTRFDRGAFFPPPLMMTVWYPLHVPASFFAYALWGSSAGAAVAALLGSRDPAVLRTLDQHAFWGWCVFSLSMICGGAWGYVAWGAYFLWDPKVVWSVILWLFYSGFVHLRHWPTGNRAAPKSVLAIVGLVLMLIAYVGTSFFFSHGSHSFG